MSRTLLGLVIVAALAVAGCANAPVGAASGPRPVAATDLLGRWYPADGTAAGRAFAEFTADGHWRGSDGCNGQSGTWSLGPGGGITGTAGMSTLIGCENVPVARWISGADRAEIDGGVLVLHGESGVARLVRELP